MGRTTFPLHRPDCRFRPIGAPGSLRGPPMNCMITEQGLRNRLITLEQRLARFALPQGARTSTRITVDPGRRTIPAPRGRVPGTGRRIVVHLLRCLRHARGQCCRKPVPDSPTSCWTRPGIPSRPSEYPGSTQRAHRTRHRSRASRFHRIRIGHRRALRSQQPTCATSISLR